jgi:hypothetical protein
MIVVPLRMEGEYFRVGIASAIFATVTLYQTVIQLWLGAPSIDAAGVVAGLPANPALVVDFWLGLFRSPVHFVALFTALYWLVPGHSLERQIGTLAVVAIFLAGSILPAVVSRITGVPLAEGYWFGLGGMLAMVGTSYYCQYDKEMTVFYCYISLPYLMDAGRTTIPSILMTVVLHILFFIWAFQWWCVFYPFLWVVVCLATWLVRVVASPVSVAKA